MNELQEQPTNQPTIQPFVTKKNPNGTTRKKKELCRIQHNQFYVPTHAKSKPIVSFTYRKKNQNERQREKKEPASEKGKEEMFALAIIKMCIVNALIDMQNSTLPKLLLLVSLQWIHMKFEF